MYIYIAHVHSNVYQYHARCKEIETEVPDQPSVVYPLTHNVTNAELFPMSSQSQGIIDTES